ncbi:polyribonucleotide nucleotidyltransferase [Bartonella bacilliformis str. Heidi Mejia]|uniref:polyribonucleotide nucleotidyltransferase n=1 Tax=Bartonella bacilliformis TaxID=774 RepID=UPI000453B266|nr:polyribonucleotide nucleotidyltransferase [Bartonella bacilliformis]EYS90932.1 polyribonucleotide nucleotidyltransferase [Bartonella bacilliformis str. Heidi Mejia]EYS95675.1 polyribonucleotide nucleotidyltransferase [Bartonella bacilliformis Peru-18]KEG15998.1 polyribonucleotide nucleotidyltransferase [Bartonella bacilliformis CUSCO5]KEG17490.1 polyribonucleotide nucleotidyltransferase [Bartonella bacilliformis Hosp800-02]KEG21875.1 polyribonucleotide nucleotidyltransferase [Bartonella bac
MFKTHKVEIEWAGRPLTIETGRVARQADGAVVATYGETVVLATVVSAKAPKPDQDFFPLTVNYQEKTYAVGKIPGGYFKRESRPSENETLISRLIDRPIRPLFVDDYKNDTQVIVSVIQHDLENNPDILSMIAASAALTLSGIPFMGPIAGARVGYCNGHYVLNPTLDEMPESKLDLVVAGTENAVLMVESEAHELSEEVMLGAITFGQKGFQPVIDAIIQLAEVAAKEPREFIPEDFSDLEKTMLEMIEKDLRKAYTITDKQQRYDAIDAIKTEILSKFAPEMEVNCELTADKIATVFKRLQAKIVRWNILDTGKRIDGRDLSTVRPIQSEVGILPRTHGSALFTRGETQALVVATLGTSEDEQYVDLLTGVCKETFLLHYNFPPFSVGETGRLSSPGRREIGHGKLAWRAIHPMLPTKEAFPYTIRVVSEITESNGSSSMATVCGTSLALMDAGVPLARPVAGIAMGLIKEGERFVILSDILGDEDHLGDMDFKVAGTKNGITSLQMDIKIDGITEDIMKIALEQAKDGRNHILNEMAKALTDARTELSEFSPRIEMMTIPVEKIREVIGSGGKVIREIVEQTGAKINIEDDGTIKIASPDTKSIETAKSWIHSIVDEPEVGTIYQGTVVKTTEFGAFINFFGSHDGLVHISQLASKRVAKTTDVVKEGDKVWVQLMGFDERGKIRLSMKVVDQQTGKEIPQDDLIKTEKEQNPDEKNKSEKKRHNRKKED